MLMFLGEVRMWTCDSKTDLRADEALFSWLSNGGVSHSGHIVLNPLSYCKEERNRPSLQCTVLHEYAAAAVVMESHGKCLVADLQLFATNVLCCPTVFTLHLMSNSSFHFSILII